MEGWIKLYRQLSENKLWTSEPFSRGQAWVDLLLIANHEYGYFYLRDHKIEVQRGQVGWSELKLSQRWMWSRSKVRKFIKDLEKEQQVVQQKSHSTSVITILNYEKYQEKEQQKDNRKTTERQQKDTNKNNKEETKNNKEVIYDEIIDEVYKAYPTKCPIKSRSLGKSSSDKKKIQKLLTKHTKEDLLFRIDGYISDCVKNKIFLKDFSTFLNNLPDIDTSTKNKKEMPEAFIYDENGLGVKNPEYTQWQKQQA